MFSFFQRSSSATAAVSTARAPAAPAGGPAADPRLGRLLREAWWTARGVLALYLILALVSYHRSDPGWSTRGSDALVANRGGHFGAWLADVLFLGFGYSAWWCVAALAFSAWQGWRQRDSRVAGDRWWLLAMPVGFIALMAGSTAIENVRLAHLRIALPGSPGGVLGEVLGGSTTQSLGVLGALLLGLALMAVGFSLYSGISWLTACEVLGRFVEGTVRGGIERARTWQDRHAGRQAAEARGVAVSEVRVKLQVQTSEPVLIAPPVMEIPKSDRVVREKQVPLFDDLPDSELPPLALLDPAEVQREAVGADTLEFTSRLIERKLLDFSVEVKVLAA